MVGCGIEAGDDVETTDGVASNEHRIFVSSGTYTGSEVNGINGADSICESLAEDAGLERDYQAIISTTGSAANDRLSFSGAIYLISGSTIKNLVASSGSSLWGSEDANLLNRVDRDENGDSVSGSVWTGTDSEGGSQPSNTCDEWTSTANDGWVGSTDNFNSQWLEDTPESCTSSYHIYCVSQ